MQYPSKQQRHIKSGDFDCSITIERRTGDAFPVIIVEQDGACVILDSEDMGEFVTGIREAWRAA